MPRYSTSRSVSRASVRSVSSARLQQKSGPSHAFGGYTKVSYSDGTYRMRPSGR